MLPQHPIDVPRRAGAPRLIDWTGERCVPWAPDVQVIYEHFHRYLWATDLVRGRRVLDVASGEGFGSALLAGTADEVVGIEIDAQTIEHSRLNYGRATLSFEHGDARDLSRFESGSFGAVVAFEMIEHVAEQARTLAEIKRVLAPDGIVIISTPDRDLYDQAGGENPFHVHELDHGEFGALLREQFEHLAMWGQRTITGSSLNRINAPGRSEAPVSRTFFIERAGDAWRFPPSLAPLYLIAVASAVELPPIPGQSTLQDGGIALIRAAEARAAADIPTIAEASERAAAELVEAQRVLAERDREIAHVGERIVQADQELATLRARTNHDAHTISSLDAALNAERRRVLRIEGSVTWQLFQRGRGRVFRLLGGEDSRQVGALQAALRFVGRGLKMGRLPVRAGRAAISRTPGSGTIELPAYDQPEVSIVIPLYSHAELTRAALESIRDHTPGLSYEVILVDDAADPATKALLREVLGARILVNPENRGYLNSVERGAENARGRWLVLCNNDIEVQPGWLAALLDCGDVAPDVAVVAPKFIYPDGSLAEAGGIIWNDGTGANYGRGQDPTRCQFEYRRDVDYGSAAALLVRRDAWHEIGGFDHRFEPMYFEDTDLCFEARSRGYRVMYEPRASVVHVEGATAGTNESTGHKRYQQINRATFVGKWQDVLAAEHLPNDPRNLWAGATMRRRPRVLIVDHRMPMWDRESGALRMRGVIEELIALGVHVSFLPDNLLPMQPYTRDLQRMGVEVLYGLEIPGDLIRILPSLSFVILSRPQVAGRWLEVIREHAPAATVVYDTVDLHWLREARRAAVDAGGEQETILSPRASAMREIELALIRATDVTLVVTDAERTQVEKDVPQATVHVLPNVNAVRTHVPTVSERRGVLFVGGFEHIPNVDGALMLVNEVMPLVWQRIGDVPVIIAGADPPLEVQALASPLVAVAGWVADLESLIDSARAMVAPLRYGAGLKGKVTQALAAGLPVVTTPIGAEGLDARDGEQMLIGITAEELAERVVRVLEDGEMWEGLSHRGQQCAAERCSPAVAREVLGQLLAPREQSAVPLT
ncbi:MAG: glycosyltransferase [Solirubrobacteraceae bacterium]